MYNGVHRHTSGTERGLLSQFLRALVLAVSIFILCLPLKLNSATHGKKFFKNYLPEEYRFHAQNWSILQHNRGIMFVVNTDGLMTYDGVGWEIISGDFHSTAQDAKGRIYAGGTNDMGFLEPNKQGSLEYTSLRNHIPANEIKRFGLVRGTHVLNDNVFFRTSRYIFKYNPDEKEMKVLFRRSPGTPPLNGSYACGGTLFIKQKGAALLQLKGDVAVPLGAPEDGAFLGTAFGILPYPGQDEKALLIGTREKGFFIYKNNRLEPFPTEIDGLLKDQKANDAIRLKHAPGEMAIATIRGGIYVINHRGRLTYRFTEDTGLCKNNVKSLYEDFEGNIWAATSYGISKIEYKSALTYYDGRGNGLSGLVQAVARYQGTLYAGTDEGVFYLDTEQDVFFNVPGLTSGCLSLLEADGMLWAATSTGIYHVSPGGIEHITTPDTYALLYSKVFPTRMYAATANGLGVLEKTGPPGNSRWAVVKVIENTPHDLRTLAEDHMGRLWLPGNGGGVQCIRFNRELEKVRFRVYQPGDNKGVPGGPIKVFRAGKHIMLGTDAGIMVYDNTSGAFAPGRRFGNWSRDGKKMIFRMARGADGSVYFHCEGNNYHAFPTGDNGFKTLFKPLARISKSWQVNDIFPEQGAVWWAAQKGLVRYKAASMEKMERERTAPFNTEISEVLVNKDLAFHRYSNETPVLPFKHRNLSFKFSAPFFQREGRTRYRYLLEGYDRAWSPWGPKNQVDYTNLDNGSFRFRVMARNIYGVQSREDTFTFSIEPPWYKTAWAYVVFVITGILLIYIGYRLRTRRLRLKTEELQREVDSKTRELISKNREIESANTQLQEMNRIQSRFYENISHEFRTPLTLIKGPLENMLAQDRPAPSKQTLEMVFRNTQRLEKLINRLLALSRLEKGVIKPKLEKLDLHRTLKEFSAAFEHDIKKKNLTFRFEAPPPPVYLYGDPGLLQDIFYNVLGNAVKFTQSGGITLGLEVLEASVEDFPEGLLRVTVCDTGVGISSGRLEHIFDRFFQVEHHEDRPDGFGLGLAITKELVLLHRGKINVASRVGENSGTEFSLMFPMGEVLLKAFPPREPVAGEPGPQRITPEIAKTEPPAALHPPAVEPVEKNAPKAHRETVLVVEDNPDMRSYIRDMIEENYHVLEAENGEVGIAAAQRKMPDLIISDVMMPKIGGYDLCANIKKKFETSHVPVILLTAKAGTGSELKGLELGADDYITKPFNREILLTRVKNLIRLRTGMREKYQQLHHLQAPEIKESSIDQQFLNRLHQLLEDNLENEDLNVEYLADLMDTTRVTLNKKIAALTSKSPKTIILDYRLDRAAKLLEQRAGTITGIAARLCFSDSSHFSRLFKKKYHCTPKQFIEGKQEKD